MQLNTWLFCNYCFGMLYFDYTKIFCYFYIYRHTYIYAYIYIYHNLTLKTMVVSTLLLNFLNNLQRCQFCNSVRQIATYYIRVILKYYKKIFTSCFLTPSFDTAIYIKDVIDSLFLCSLGLDAALL